MPSHKIYFGYGPSTRAEPPPLDLVLYGPGEDDPADVEEAGRKYGRWLIQNASGNWTKGLRRAFKEMPTMETEEGSKNEGH